MINKRARLIILQDPAMSGMLESLTNPSNKSQLEDRMSRIKEDPSLKPILDEIESGGPAAMMRSFLSPSIPSSEIYLVISTVPSHSYVR